MLTDTIYKKFPELLAVREDLGAVAVAAKGLREKAEKNITFITCLVHHMIRSQAVPTTFCYRQMSF